MRKSIEYACNQYDSERDISGRAGGNYGHYLADQIIFEKEIETLGKENELEGIIGFIKLADGMEINPDDLFSNRDVKERLIRKYIGYTSLNFSGQKYKKKEKGIPLSECSDHKIGLVFKKLYCSISKKMKS